MKYPYALITVFSDFPQNLKGNTAAVVLLDKDLNDQQMQDMAADLNQPATTFLQPMEKDFHYNVRWFAPDAEIGLCGHGSMAAVAFINKYFKIKNKELTFHFNNGIINGKSLDSESGSLSFDVIHTEAEDNVPEGLTEALGIPIQAYFKTSNKDIVLVEDENLVKNMRPDFSLLKRLKPFGYIVTAASKEVDFVSRTLIPHVQQLEDPATGSSHTVLTAFWAKRLNKYHMVAKQLSKRGGLFICDLETEKVILSGNYTVFAEGEIQEIH